VIPGIVAQVRHQSIDECTNFPLSLNLHHRHSVGPARRAPDNLQVGPRRQEPLVIQGKLRQSRELAAERGFTQLQLDKGAHLSTKVNPEQYASMMQDGLQIAGPLGGGKGVLPHTHTHPYSHPNLSNCPLGRATDQGWGARPFIFFSPVQTGLTRELAELLTRATQPGLVSPGGGDQDQWYHPASL
jgi:hypothetical protein